MTSTWRPTKVQQDVIDRLKAGWELCSHIEADHFELTKAGEAPRHVGAKTVWSLFDRNAIRMAGRSRWVLA